MSKLSRQQSKETAWDDPVSWLSNSQLSRPPITFRKDSKRFVGRLFASPPLSLFRCRWRRHARRRFTRRRASLKLFRVAEGVGVYPMRAAGKLPKFGLCGGQLRALDSHAIHRVHVKRLGNKVRSDALLAVLLTISPKRESVTMQSFLFSLPRAMCECR